MFSSDKNKENQRVDKPAGNMGFAKMGADVSRVSTFVF